MYHHGPGDIPHAVTKLNPTAGELAQEYNPGRPNLGPGQVAREYIGRSATGRAEAPHFSRAYGESERNTLEFISDEGAERLVSMVMEGRVDPVTRKLLPLEEERFVRDGPGYWMRPLPSIWRYDLVLPEPPRTQPHRGGGTLDISQKYSIEGALYSGLIDEHQINLKPTGIERQIRDRKRLEQSLTNRHDLKWKLFDDQLEDAYHVSQDNKPAPGSDGKIVSPVRVYVPGGVRGSEIASRVVEAGADFARAKIWVPQAAHGEQSFQRDTPIFIVHTAQQLRSVVSTLRTLAAQGLIESQATSSPLGIPVEGIPGAFVAQPIEGNSFNGAMARFWEEPIRIACNSLPLRAGQVVTPQWMSEAARRAAVIARTQARAAGINPAHHALVRGQNLAFIMEVVRP